MAPLDRFCPTSLPLASPSLPFLPLPFSTTSENSCDERNPFYLGPLWESNQDNAPTTKVAYGQAYANIQCDSCELKNVTCRLCVATVVNKLAQNGCVTTRRKERCVHFVPYRLDGSYFP